MLKKDLEAKVKAMQSRLDAVSKAYCLRLVAMRCAMIEGWGWDIKDNELAAMRAMFNQPHFVEMEMTCDRCDGSGDYRFPDRVAECWKCTHGRMMKRAGKMTIIDIGGEDARHVHNLAEEDRRMALEDQQPKDDNTHQQLLVGEVRCVCGEKYDKGDKCTYSRCPTVGEIVA